LARFGRTSEPGYQRNIVAATPGPVRTKCGIVPVEIIAKECGFGNAKRMRRTFRRLFNVSPHDYRARFRLTLLA